jgi:phosphoglycerate dehydrogenase-like enzyme
MNVFIAFPDNEFRRAFFTEDRMKPLSAYANISWNPYTVQLKPDEVAAYISQTNIYLGGWQTPQLNFSHIEASYLQLICNIGNLKGSIHRDVFERGFPVSSSNDGFAKSVAEFALILLLMSFRKVYPSIAQMKKDTAQINKIRNIGNSLYGKTFGLLGYGSIARELIVLLHAFDVNVIVCDEYCSVSESIDNNFRLLPLDAFLQECDAASIHHTLTSKLSSTRRAGRSLTSVL